jgi:hypothetical protein
MSLKSVLFLASLMLAGLGVLPTIGPEGAAAQQCPNGQCPP